MKPLVQKLVTLALRRNPPASEAAISRLISTCPYTLPAGLIETLRECNGMQLQEESSAFRFQDQNGSDPAHLNSPWIAARDSKDALHRPLMRHEKLSLASIFVPEVLSCIFSAEELLDDFAYRSWDPIDESSFVRFAMTSTGQDIGIFAADGGFVAAASPFEMPDELRQSQMIARSFDDFVWSLSPRVVLVKLGTSRELLEMTLPAKFAQIQFVD